MREIWLTVCASIRNLISLHMVILIFPSIIRRNATDTFQLSAEAKFIITQVRKSLVIMRIRNTILHYDLFSWLSWLSTNRTEAKRSKPKYEFLWFCGNTHWVHFLFDPPNSSFVLGLNIFDACTQPEMIISSKGNIQAKLVKTMIDIRLVYAIL